MEDAIFFLVAAAGQLQSTEEAKAQAEQQQIQLQDELAGLKATEGRLRERLAKREARSLERKQVGAVCLSSLLLYRQSAWNSENPCLTCHAFWTAAVHVSKLCKTFPWKS